jgi:hypothetical protein
LLRASVCNTQVEGQAFGKTEINEIKEADAKMAWQDFAMEWPRANRSGQALGSSGSSVAAKLRRGRKLTKLHRHWGHLYCWAPNVIRKFARRPGL